MTYQSYSRPLDIQGTITQVLLDPTIMLPFIVSSSLLVISKSSTALLCCRLPCCTVFCKLFSIFGVDASLFSVFLEPLCLIFLLRAPHRRLPLGFVNQAYRRHGQTIVVVAKRGPAHAHQSINQVQGRFTLAQLAKTVVRSLGQQLLYQRWHLQSSAEEPAVEKMTIYPQLEHR